MVIAVALALGGCGGGARAPIVLEAPPAAAALPVEETAEDSAADAAALSALRELEFNGLGKGSDHARGVLPIPGLAGLDGEVVSEEADRLFTGARGGAESAAGPTFDIDVESFSSRQRVQYYMDFFLGEARDRFTIWLGRLNRYEGMIRSRFRQRGVPEDLVYLGIVESGYSNTAVSRAQAVGMWQFIRATGKRYSLQVDDWVDERRDPFRATDAAAQHLLDLNTTFGSWYLAAAAYNGGAGRVTRGIRRLPGDKGEVSDETFFDLSDRQYLRRETRDYVPKLIAAALIAKEPRRYGFDSLPFLEPLVFDEITVPDATGLDVLARLADTTTAALAELNPHYYRGVTPPGRSSIVRVPRGTGADVARRYAELPPSERVTFLDHVVRAGETLSGIGQRYGVSVSLLRAANGGVDPRRLRVGSRLVIPVSSAARRAPTRRAASPLAAAPAPRRAVSAPSAGRAAFHVVQRGETVWLLAQRYDVRVADIKLWNDLDDATVIRVGQRLRVAAPEPPVSSR
ncbi:MAG: hypothetical protein A2W29_07600 [Gemmatimonadetes bacterium RBG_16_66_8]|nr:MAG: hypothetical protein A2W29_07600 [Gemmatimonadetes bacterium RBG_16_66_8]